MKNQIVLILVLSAMLVACAAPTPTPVPPTATPLPTATAVPPTATPAPTATRVPPTATPVPTATPFGGGGKIAFMSDKDGAPNIYTMNADGTSIVQLTKTQAVNVFPFWSPDGKRIAFSVNATNQPFQWRVFVMNADGSDAKAVTNFSSAAAHWSPDGKQFVMNSDRDLPTPDVPEVFVVNADGTNPTRLTNLPANADAQPKWSPDGKKIVFFTNRDGNNEVYLMDADGKNPANLTRHPASDSSPRFSPDCRKIAFVSNRDGNSEVYVMDSNGANVKRLTNDPASDNYPAWSPDGTKIVFSSRRSGNSDLFIMNADGANVVQVTKTPEFEDMPDWQQSTFVCAPDAIAAPPPPPTPAAPPPLPTRALPTPAAITFLDCVFFNETSGSGGKSFLFFRFFKDDAAGLSGTAGMSSLGSPDVERAWNTVRDSMVPGNPNMKIGKYTLKGNEVAILFENDVGGGQKVTVSFSGQVDKDRMILIQRISSSNQITTLIFLPGCFLH
ncbi:MAG: PD40 domain-containing protein [Chloroflexi bacterium]|nr:PD40 domain-containing protein [Chloroflexota bacterium]